LVGLMERFELCYRLEAQQETWLIPQLLSPQTPRNVGDKWFNVKATRLRYEYNVLPEGLMARFIVRSHPLVTENLVWRQGAVLEMDDEDSGDAAQALVIAEPGRERIQVVVIGGKAARLRLTKLVRAHFQDIHEDFDRIDSPSKERQNNLNARETIELEDQPGLYISVKALLIDEKSKRVTGLSTDHAGTISVYQQNELNRVAAPRGKERNQIGSTQNISKQKYRIFLSYSHRDATYRDIFMQNLRLMESDGIIESWHDGKVLASQDFDHEIRHALVSADVIIFLVSTASLSSNYIQEVELEYALNPILNSSPKRKNPLVIPILLEQDCSWRVEGEGRKRKFDHLQILPGDRAGNLKAVDQWPSRRKAFNVVEQALRRLLKENY
jgi:internalin A